jgi:hypothetical protein
MSSPPKPQGPSERRPGGGQETARISGVATARYTSADKLRAASRLMWWPVLALVDVVDWLLGRAGGLAMLALLAAAAYVGRALLPPYVAHFALRDEVAEIGRAPTRDDDLVRLMLAEAVRRSALGDHIPADVFEVTMAGNRRRIAGAYKIPVELVGRRFELSFGVDLDQWVALPEPTQIR